MDVRDDFFFNASFTLLSGPRMHGFTAAHISDYKKTLLEYLQRVSETSDLDEDQKGQVELKWKHWGSMRNHPGVSENVTYSLDMIFIRYNRTLHRLCVVTRHHLKDRLEILKNSIVVMANATPEVLDVYKYWMVKQFDTALVPFIIARKVMFNEYDLYLKGSARASGFGTDSELVFAVQEEHSKKLKEVTVAVSGQDLPGYLANGYVL